MNDFDERDDLWKLLGKAKKNAISPLFSRNVLREVRTLKKDTRRENPGLPSWLRGGWALASACGLAAILLAVNAPRLFIQHKAPAPVVVQAQQTSSDASKPDDIEVINHLDELVACEENSVWLEDSSN